MRASQVTRTLEKKGLIARVRLAGDSRANSVSITPAGGKALQEALGIALRAREEFFAPLGSEEAVLNGLLSRLIELHQDSQ